MPLPIDGSPQRLCMPFHEVLAPNDLLVNGQERLCTKPFLHSRMHGKSLSHYQQMYFGLNEMERCHTTAAPCAASS
jgi:hypothetical protein